jgi:hypothetical protein
MTISQIASECIRRNIRLSDMTLTVSNKVFYDRSWGANPNGAFIEVSRPEAADPTAEFNAMHYLDVQKYVPDWTTTLNNLKRLGQDRLYTEDMMKTCLLRLVNRFIPDQSQLIKNKTSNQIAKMLLKLDSRVDKMTNYRQQLFAAHRLPGEALQGAMTRFQNLLNIVYPPSEVGHASTRAEMLKTAIISFLPDCVAIPLTAEMQRRSYKGKALTFQEICSRAYKASNDLMTEVAIPLQFCRNIGQDSAAKLIQFNSIQTVNRPILKPKQTIVNDYNRMYHTGFPLYTSPRYPNFPPLPPEARGQLGPAHGANHPLYRTPMPIGKQPASANHRAAPTHAAGESQVTQQWREAVEAKNTAQQYGSPEPVIAYMLLSPNQGLTQENGALYTVINGIKTRVIDAPEDIATPQNTASTPGSQPLSRQQLQQLQYDALATPTTTRPQEWSCSSLEDNRDNLQLDSDEAAASIPAPARTTPNVTTRSMARNAASNSQLNSIETAEINTTYPQRDNHPPQNGRGRQEAKPRSQSRDNS